MNAILLQVDPNAVGETVQTAVQTAAGASLWLNPLYLVAASLFIFGLKGLSSPKTARRGNGLAALGMLIAVLVTLVGNHVLSWAWIILGVVLGTGLGAWWAKAVPMTAMPQMVAVFNGLGGLASALVAWSEYVSADEGAINTIRAAFMGVSVLVGMVTFSGSMVAYAKLDGKMTGSPILLPHRHWINIGLGALTVLLIIVFTAKEGDAWFSFSIVMLASLALGVLLTIPIGGADMPVVISLLNSYSGIAAAMTGFVLANDSLVICGLLVGASGLILTQIMCKAMNRSLANVLFGGFGTGDAPSGAPSGAGGQVSIREINAEDAALVMENAKLVIVVPGYGMAVAQAQHLVREVADKLASKGAVVKYAIHPVAGRMPGHMNVLLAEANVPYSQLHDLDDINPEFDRCDVALVIGANDVTNPAARHDTSSPIYGMPILNVDKAKTVIVCKRSMRPGFAGVDNELYGLSNTYMLFGDAAKSMTNVLEALKAT